MGLEELALEKCSLAVPLIYYREKCSEHGAGNLERKISGGTSACKKKFRSLLVTIENHTPKIELAQSLRTRALPKILPFPKETKKSYKCPECDQSFSDSSYLVWHQKTHVGKKKCECDDCGKIFNHRSNLRAHRRIHTGEKPYKCFSPVWSAAQCGSSPRTCFSTGRPTWRRKSIGVAYVEGGSRSSGDCHSIRKPTLPQKPAINMLVRKQIWLCLRKSTGKPPSSCAAPAGNVLGSPRIPAQERPQGQSEHYSNWGEILLSFSKFKPLKCSTCSKTFLSASELISHQSIHRREKPHRPKTCMESFILDSELACHQKSHTREEPLKCTRCGRNFRLKTHLTLDQQTHSQNTV